jgi:hypothetical protein
MASKFTQWFKAIKEASDHAAHAGMAEAARVECVGKDRLVEKHLRRISERERRLSEFVGHIANSPALNHEDE